MRNYKFLLSDVKPMAWIYKLKEMRKPKTNSHKPQSNNRKQPKTDPVPEPPLTASHQPRKPSFNFTTLEEDIVLSPPAHDQDIKFPNSKRRTHQNPSGENPNFLPAEPPRKSSSKTRPRRIKTHSSCRCSCHNGTFKNKYTKEEEEESPLGHFHKRLPRISANPPKFLQLGKKTTDDEEDVKASPRARNPGIRVKLRLNSSPRIGGRKIQMVRGRRSVESVAIAKASCDPQRDFMESMMAMIVEHNIRAPGDLEELLARYLSLNSNEYHDLIVKVFEEIWFILNDVHQGNDIYNSFQK